MGLGGGLGEGTEGPVFILAGPAAHGSPWNGQLTSNAVRSPPWLTGPACLRRPSQLAQPVSQHASLLHAVFKMKFYWEQRIYQSTLALLNALLLALNGVTFNNVSEHFTEVQSLNKQQWQEQLPFNRKKPWAGLSSYWGMLRTVFGALRNFGGTSHCGCEALQRSPIFPWLCCILFPTLMKRLADGRSACRHSNHNVQCCQGGTQIYK